MTKRTCTPSVRFTVEEWELIQRKARSANIPPTTFLRRAGLQRKVIHRTTPEAIQALNRVGVNLNQLTRIANTTGHVPAELQAVLARVEEAVDELLDA